ncbi:ATP-binding cassette subfamily C protein [Variibacter gotjawalensis]|nr:type I secretion system permease/ATPase [Variibacter gotjawalensis]NIK47879.1 ATP-binding cassette subfamily C protein [Variibacter gotjawalensis]
MKATAPAFVTVLVFSFFINILMLVSPLYMLQVYERVLASRSITTLIGITILAGLLLAVYAGLEGMRSRVLIRAGILFDEKIAQPVFDAVHRGNLRQPGSQHKQCLKDIDTLREFVTGQGMLALCDAPWFPVFIGAAFILHPYFGFIGLGASVIIFGLSILNEFITKKILNNAAQASMAAANNADATFRNTEVLQAMGMLQALRTRWLDHHSTHLAWQARASDRGSVILSSTKFFRTFIQIVILGTGAYLVIEREASPGAMIAASIIIGRALAPIELAVASWKGFVAARSAAARLSMLFSLGADAETKIALPRPAGSVFVDRILAGAPGQPKPILQGVSFGIQAGELLAVIGPSAAGKSSLARVLVGVWPIASGAVRLDGSDLSHWDPQLLGKHIGYLPQDIELFSGTVAQNIARFQEIDEAALFEAATLAGCHELIQQLPNGYNSQIGEGGAILSGGQRQRIGLARAFYGKPSLVVLDEPNANLDAAGEEALLRALQRAKQLKMTVVTITHKINILAVVDKILLMNGGTVQMFGDREQVLSKIAGPKVVSQTPQAPPQPTAATGAAQ